MEIADDSIEDKHEATERPAKRRNVSDPLSHSHVDDSIDKESHCGKGLIDLPSSDVSSSDSDETASESEAKHTPTVHAASSAASIAAVISEPTIAPIASSVGQELALPSLSPAAMEQSHAHMTPSIASLVSADESVPTLPPISDLPSAMSTDALAAPSGAHLDPVESISQHPPVDKMDLADVPEGKSEGSAPEGDAAA